VQLIELESVCDLLCKLVTVYTQTHTNLSKARSETKSATWIA